MRDSKLSSPLFYILRATIERYRATDSTVVGVLNSRCPPAITWLVIAVIVATIELQTGGPLAHVSKERGERGQPLWADTNSTPTVAGVGLVIGVSAALHHADPGGENGRWTPIVSPAVSVQLHGHAATAEIPVEPNPFAPRSVSERTWVSTTSTRSTGAMTSWAMRSPCSIIRDWPWLTRMTEISPR